MIQSYNELHDNILIFEKKLIVKAHIQKIQSTPTTFCLRVRLPGETIFIHIGRGHGVEGLWINMSSPKADVRIKDKFDDWLKKKLRGSIVKSIKLDTSYKIIEMDLIKREGQSRLFFYYKGRRLYFAIIENGVEKTIFKSWVGKVEINTDAENQLAKEVFGDLYSGAFPKKEGICKQGIAEHYENLLKLKKNTKRKKILTKKIEELDRKLEDIIEIKKIQPMIGHQSEEEISTMFKKHSLKIKIKQGETIYQFRDRAFSKIKNFKNSKNFHEKKLKDLSNELINLALIKVISKTIYPEWNTVNHKKSIKHIFEFRIGNIKGAVGKNVRGNDYLRNRYAKQTDMWFHLEGDKSCHLVLKCKKADLGSEIIKTVGSIIRDHSKQKQSEIRLIASEMKNIRGLKGKKGAVTIKDPQYFKVLYNSKWKEILSED